MDFANFIKYHFSIHDMPIDEEDLPYIQHLLHTIHQAKAPLTSQTEVSQEVPITIVDPEVILYD